MSKLFFFRVPVALAISTACLAQIRSSGVPRSASPQQASAATSGSGEIRLRPYSVQDPELHVEALRFLMPVDWKVEGGVVWRANPTHPASFSIRIYNPGGVEEMGAVPDIPCVWAVTLPRFGFQIGSYYLGNEVRPPVADAIQALRTLILPRYATQVPGARVVKQEALDEMAQSVAAANYPDLIGKAKFTGGKIRVEYRWQEKPAEMNIYAIMGAWSTPIQGVPTTFWGVDGIRYSRAERGKLDQQFKLMETVLYSEKLNIQWLNLYTQVQQLMIRNQMEASNRAVELSRYLAQTNRQISDGIRQSYEQRQAATDRAVANFDRYIRGVDQYRAPGGGFVELPSGYRNVWGNSLGEYILSDNANFNPNVGSAQGWQQLPRQP